MKFSPLVSLVTLSLFASRSQAVSLSYDNTYGVPGGSLNTVACSDGSHGLIPRGFTTFGSLPNYPRIGGVDAIKGWNSPLCGSCYQLTYTNTTGAKKSINVLAVDSTRNGYNIALPAMRELVGEHAADIGRVDVDAKQVDTSLCGLR